MSRESTGGAYISPAAMYDQLQKLETVVVGMDAKLDALACQTERLGDHEERLRQLEERRLPAAALGWISLVVATVVGVLSLKNGA